MLHHFPTSPHKHSPLISHKTIHTYRRSLESFRPALLQAKSSSLPDNCPRTVRVRGRKKLKLRQELLVPILEPKLKLPSLPAKLRDVVASTTFGRMASALRIPTTRRSDEDDDDSIKVYRELKMGQGLVFCPQTKA